jgi:hypothetical protein
MWAAFINGFKIIFKKIYKSVGFRIVVGLCGSLGQLTSLGIVVGFLWGLRGTHLTNAGYCCWSLGLFASGYTLLGIAVAGELDDLAVREGRNEYCSVARGLCCAFHSQAPDATKYLF